MEFDVIDYVKREWKIALVIIILFNIISAFIMFKGCSSYQDDSGECFSDKTSHNNIV